MSWDFTSIPWELGVIICLLLLCIGLIVIMWRQDEKLYQLEQENRVLRTRQAGYDVELDLDSTRTISDYRPEI